MTPVVCMVLSVHIRRSQSVFCLASFSPASSLIFRSKGTPGDMSAAEVRSSPADPRVLRDWHLKIRITDGFGWRIKASVVDFSGFSQVGGNLPDDRFT